MLFTEKISFFTINFLVEVFSTKVILVAQAAIFTAHLKTTEKECFLKMIALILPCIQKNQVDTRDRIVSILTEYWPLTTKTIYSVMTRQKGQSITYQGVQKTLKQLLSQGIVVRYDKKYYLNSDWIQQVKKFVIDFEQNYQKPVETKELNQDERITQVIDQEEIIKKQPTG